MIEKFRYLKGNVGMDKLAFFENCDQYFIKQKVGTMETYYDWESVNQYDIFNSQRKIMGHIAERSGGFMEKVKRCLLGSHRPLTMFVLDEQNQPFLYLYRPFFWFCSDLKVFDKPGGRLIGSVQRRYGIISKIYDLISSNDVFFARIKSPFWTHWNFPIMDKLDIEKGIISKKWAGLMTEYFTDNDSFIIDYKNGNWSNEQKAIIFSAAISIDFDYFENNSAKKSNWFPNMF